MTEPTKPEVNEHVSLCAQAGQLGYDIAVAEANLKVARAQLDQVYLRIEAVNLASRKEAEIRDKIQLEKLRVEKSADAKAKTDAVVKEMVSGGIKTAKRMGREASA